MQMKWTFALATTLLIAGCHSSPEEGQMNNAAETNTSIVPSEAPADMIPLNESQLPTNTAAVENRAAPPEISDAQQIQDDADATGMTSRLPDEGAAPSPTPESTPDQSSAAPH